MPAKKTTAAKPAGFQNRIVKYGVKPADQFLANPANPRIHPQFQRDVMQAALSTVGFVAPVIETSDGYLLDGHERIWQASKDNSEVPYVVLDIDSNHPDAAYVLATFDPITSLAGYDAGKLDALLQEVNSDSPAIQQMLAELAEKNNIAPLPEDWKEYDESTADDVEYITCPHCGEKFPK